MKHAHKSMVWLPCAVLITAIGLAACSKKPEQTAKNPAPIRPVTSDSFPENPPTRPAPPVISAPSPNTRTTTVVPATNPATRPTTMPATRPAISMSMPATAPLRPDLRPPADDKTATFLGLAGPKPATWIWQPPASSFNVVEYTVPGVEGADQAKISVSSVGGTIEANIERWKGQFRNPAGDEVVPKVTKLEIADMPVTIVEIAGEYKGMGMVIYAPDQLFLTAIVQAPVNQIFVKFVGPRKTVEANREAFMSMIKGLHRVEPEK